MFLPPRSKKIRALVDCDSFFASCEVARNPSLQWKPVCAYRSGIVLAATYEAKRYGVKTAMGIWEAKRLLQWTWAVFKQTDMAYYERVSRKVFSLLAKSSIKREQYSIDEAFFERTGLCTTDSIESYAKTLQHQIYQATQIWVSIGVWRTRILAKMFAKLDKPKGITVWITWLSIRTKLYQLPIQEIPFIGRKRSRKLFVGATVWDFISISWENIRKKMGWDWLKIRLELQEFEAIRINRKWGPVSIWRAKSFHPHFTWEIDELRKRCIHNFEKVYIDLTQQGLATCRISVSLKTKSFQIIRSTVRFPLPTINREVLLQAMKWCLIQCYVSWTLYRQTIIVCSELRYQNMIQSSLFQKASSTVSNQHQRIYTTITKLNKKYWARIISTARDKKSIQSQSPKMIWTVL